MLLYRLSAAGPRGGDLEISFQEDPNQYLFHIPAILGLSLKLYHMEDCGAWEVAVVPVLEILMPNVGRRRSHGDPVEDMVFESC